MKKLTSYFTKFELALWFSSVAVIIASYIIFGVENYFTLAASLAGTAMLILNAKGNPLGQALAIVFSIMYAVISFSYAYYGEMITYLGMTAPMAALSLVSWLRNPFKGKKSEVTVNRPGKKEIALMLILSAVVTAAFCYILKSLSTANLEISTASITTSFIAAYLTARRSPYFGLAYASNDVVLIVMWIMAALENPSYFSVVICFVVFLFNDIYGFVNWKRMRKKQSAEMRKKQSAV